jgi:hypothetical protein
MDSVTAAPVRTSSRRDPVRWSAREHHPKRSGPSTPGKSLRIAMLAPPWISVPPNGYGGVESVVSALTEALFERGHSVTLLRAPGSVSSARVVSLLDRPYPDEIERSVYEVDHVARAFGEIDRAQRDGCAFDVVHDHCGFAALAMADRLDTPLVHTVHGPFIESTGAFYAQHAAKATLVGISQAQIASAPSVLRDAVAIPNPIDMGGWPLQERKDDYVLWVGTASRPQAWAAGSALLLLTVLLDLRPGCAQTDAALPVPPLRSRSSCPSEPGGWPSPSHSGVFRRQRARPTCRVEQSITPNPLSGASAMPHLTQSPDQLAHHETDDQRIKQLVARLSRPHSSGGLVIERAAILADGGDFSAVMGWITAHAGEADATAATSAGRGLHGSRVHGTGATAPTKPLRFLLPADAID